MGEAMTKRLSEVREGHFKLKSLIEADQRFSKRQTAITVQKGSQMEDMELKTGLVLKNASGDVIKQGEVLKKSKIKRTATSR
jgi:hypothetical protein